MKKIEERDLIGNSYLEHTRINYLKSLRRFSTFGHFKLWLIIETKDKKFIFAEILGNLWFFISNLPGFLDSPKDPSCSALYY